MDRSVAEVDVLERRGASEEVGDHLMIKTMKPKLKMTHCNRNIRTTSDTFLVLHELHQRLRVGVPGDRCF